MSQITELPYRCVECTQPVPNLYVYQTYAASLLLVDMLLFKRGVYRHLLWNRGPADLRMRSKQRTKIALALGVASVVVDAFIRCIDVDQKNMYGHPLWLFARACMYCIIENASLFLSIAASALIVLRLTSRTSRVHLSTLPLALVYAYVPTLFLLLISSVIWRKEYLRGASTDQQDVPQPTSFLAELSEPILRSAFNDSTHSTVSNALVSLASLSRNNLQSGISRVGASRGWANEALLRKIVGGTSALISVSVMLNTSRRKTAVILLLAWCLHLFHLHMIDPWLS